MWAGWQGELSHDERLIIGGAMKLIGKTVTQLVRPLHGTFMLDAAAVLDDSTVRRITLSGFSRIPVHAPGDRCTVLGLLVVKNLIVLNPHVRPAPPPPRLSFHLVTLARTHTHTAHTPPS